MILFCLPYAGGSKTLYYEWKNYLEPSINLYPIELKGRGMRFNEGFYENISEAVDDIFNIIKNELNHNEYAIYGHSMGSLLAYELYYKINALRYKKPNHIFFSGYGAPGNERDRENISTLPDSDFAKKIIELGGTPEEVINNKEILDICIPIMRNDFRMLENYQYKKKEVKIQCDISIFNGKQDSIKLEQILAWNNYTDKKFKIYNFDGDHFFINNNIKNITNIINNTLLNGKDL